MTDKNPLLTLDVDAVELYDVAGGYELVMDVDDGHDLVAYVSPKDGVWEQLVQKGLIERDK